MPKRLPARTPSQKRCTTYLDDILIYSENELDHEEHVKGSYSDYRMQACKLTLRSANLGLNALNTWALLL